MELVKWCSRLARDAQAAACLARYRFSRRTFRRQERSVRCLEHAGKPVLIERDALGIPTASAATEASLYFGQGYAMATDRCWQMDLLRRQAAGRLSEVFGESTAKLDAYHRTLGLERIAGRSLDLLENDSAGLLAAFCDGVNAALADLGAGTRLLPVEFALLGYRPQPWRPEDSILILKLMSLQLSMNAKYKVFMHELLRHFSFEEVAALAAREDAGDFVTIGHAQAGSGAARIPLRPAALELDLSRLLNLFRPAQAKGSNAWVVSGRHSANGYPILANDPHLPFALPAPLHQCRLRCTDAENGFTVAGVNVPGSPGIISGHNQDIAWGITNSQVDQQDIAILTPGADHTPQHALFESECWSEEIRIKGARPRPVKVCFTPIGPSLRSLCQLPSSGPEVAFAWSGLLPATDVHGLFLMARARDWHQFRQGLSHLQSPSFNVLFASRSGDIGFKTVGRVPLRPEGLQHTPSSGTWAGFVPFDDLPETINPDGGIIVNANNPIADRRQFPPLTTLWNPSYRARRIADLLAGRTGLTPEDMRDIQNDVLNLHARDLLPTLLAALRPHEADGDPAFHRALELLSGWDCRDSEDSDASVVWHRFFSCLSRTICGERFVPYLPYFDDERQAISRLACLASGDVTTPWLDGCQALGRAAALALKETAAKLGPVAHWPRWGAHRRLRFTHTLSGALGPLRRWVDVEGQPRAGSTVTVALNAGDTAVSDGAVWSLVATFSDSDSIGLSTLLPGQSGDFRSRWYADQFALSRQLGNRAVAHTSIGRGPLGPGKPGAAARRPPRRVTNELHGLGRDAARGPSSTG
jgi:penicillin amidase